MVARRAHNPKVVGSNPAPATKFQPLGIPSGFVLSFTFLLVHIRYNKQNFTVFLRDGFMLPNDEIIIHGTTSDGKVFRPSDWAERLCGILSSFSKDNRLSYHEWVRPALLNKVRCVEVSPNLEEINPNMFRFLMDFAADNDLQIMRGSDFSNHRQPENQIAKSAKNDKFVVKEKVETEQNFEKKEEATSHVREILPKETASVFAALSVLRPTLNDINQFVEQVNNVQRAQGYRLLGLFEAGKTNAVAVCGFREKTDLVSGRHIYIDDLITIPQSRRRGYASRLLDKVHQIAVEQGITQIHVDCHVGSERTIAHRVYFQQGFEIQSYHFVCQTSLD